MINVIKIYNLLLKLILPTRCVSCDITLDDDAGLCQKCWNKIHFISGIICVKCGYPLEFDLSDGKNNMLCGKCLTHKNHFDSARSVCSYGNIVGKFIGRLKYGDNLHIAKFVAKSMLPLFLQHYKDCDIICPVPMHKKALQKRTFNQSALIIVILVKMLKQNNINIKYIPDLLQKIKITKKQNQLTRTERLENVKNSFAVNTKYSIYKQKVVILDDVITTGATISECSKILKKYDKTAKIHAISFARTTLGSIDYEQTDL
jgi:ComF family protein